MPSLHPRSKLQCGPALRRGPARPLLAVACCALLSIAFASAAYADPLNIESLAEGVKKRTWGGGVRASVSLAHGNVDLVDLRGQFGLRWSTPHPAAPSEKQQQFTFFDRVLLFGSATFRRTDGRTSVNGGFAHVRYTRMPWLWLGGEVYGQLQYDEIILLERRLLGGLGLRSVVISRDTFAIWFGTGYMLEREKRNIAPENRPPRGPDPEWQTAHRWNNYLTCEFRLIEDRLTLINVLYVQPRFDDLGDLRLLEQLELVFKLNDSFSFSSDVFVGYDSRPPLTVEATDVAFTQSLTFSF